MASSSRASRRLADTLLFQKSVPFVCRSCRHQALRQRISLLQQSRSASDNSLPYTEKVRRKLWGTDNPPGLKDPYGGPSFLEKRRMRQEARERGEYLPQAESYEEVDPTQMAEASQKMPEEAQDYVPAETWDGLEHMGHEGHWADVKPRPEDRYQSFSTGAVLHTREDVVRCIGQARADVLALEELRLEGEQLPTDAIDLQAPQTFNVLKRFMMLSGVRISDPIIGKSKTWEMLIDGIAKDLGPKPKNIAETLMMKENLANLPNLKIMSRRETSVDKEKEVGRWKVIEVELKERGLPVLGKVSA